MPNYDFRLLSSFDFEQLVRDLLQEEWKVRLEAFTSGRDEGIDLRYSSDTGRTLVVQCKHYAGSDVSHLLTHLKTDEQPKVERLRPNRYVIATSLGLSPKNKSDIQVLFAPYCSSPRDIYGRDDLNNLLGWFPSIERRHFKLWLTSQTVLDRVLHSEIFTQSAWELEHIERKLMLYVQNDSFGKASEILEKYHFVVIAGVPGIGKTTLAQMLLVDHMTRDYEAIRVVQNIEEAIRVFEAGARQIFYYDDFLGQTSLAAKLGKNEDELLMRFFEAVQDSRTARSHSDH